MKKNKGFTLIELLAVIVILAVIALIATPIVIGIINDSKKKAAETSMHGIIDAANFYAAGQGVKQEPIESPIDLTGNTLSYQGKKPEKGVLIFSTEQDIQATAYLNGYCLQKNFGDSKVYFIDANKEQCGSMYSMEGTITFVYGSEYSTRENYKDAPTVKLIQNGSVVKIVKLNFDDITINAMNSTVNYKIDSIPYGTYDIEFSMLYHMPYTYKNYTVDHNFEDFNARIFKGDFDSDGVSSKKDGQYILDTFLHGTPKCPNDILYCFPYIDVDGDNRLTVSDQTVTNNGASAVEVYNKNVTFSGKTNIPNTKIVLKRNMENPIETISDVNGNFAFENIPAGTYRITISNGGLYTTYDNVITITENETDIIIEQFWSGNTGSYVSKEDVKGYYNNVKYWEDSPYDANYDINKDGSINLEDYESMKINFGKQTIFKRPTYVSNKEEVEITIQACPNSIINLSAVWANGYNEYTNDSQTVSITVKKGTYYVKVNSLYWVITPVQEYVSITSPITMTFNCKYGDFDFNGSINSFDLKRLTAEITKYNTDPNTADIALYDMNDDHILDDKDVALLTANISN